MVIADSIIMCNAVNYHSITMVTMWVYIRKIEAIVNKWPDKEVSY